MWNNTTLELVLTNHLMPHIKLILCTNVNERFSAVNEVNNAIS